MPIFIICAASCVGLLALVFVKSAVRIGHTSVSIYWVPPFLGALLLPILGLLPWSEIFSGMTADGEINPIKILILFLSMTLLSILLDEAGFFRFLASYALKRAGRSQKKLFFLLYGVVSVLTVFTSNDIIVLTFTPFLCYFAKHARIDPLPYLFCEFVAANTWSMALLIGNPTNIYLGASAGISFVEYMKVMLLPTVLGGLASLAVLWLLFHKSLSQPMDPVEEGREAMDLPLVILGAAHLLGALLFMVLSSWVAIPMWLISLLFFLSLYISATVMQCLRHQSGHAIIAALERTPLEIVPFVLSMFVLVLGMQSTGATAWIGEKLSLISPVFSFGITSFFMANIVNNIPMSVLYSTIVSAAPCAHLPAVYASVVGSNLGAFFAPIGALAGIMWTALLRRNGLQFSFFTFIKYGALIAIPTLFVTLGGLELVLGF